MGDLKCSNTSGTYCICPSNCEAPKGTLSEAKSARRGGGAYNSCEDPESFLPKYNDSYLYFFFCYYKHSIVLPVIAS